MRVLIACEYSGVVTWKFRERGHEAYSCDFLPTETEGGMYHFRCDVRDLLVPGAWDLMIAFPPCTHLCISGARWFKEKREEQKAALDFVFQLMTAPVERIAIENPLGVISTMIRKPNQIVHPYFFGHGEVKSTCLWLKNLPLITPTNMVDGREARVHRMAPGPNRWKERSRTYEGFAQAMAEQWG